MIILFLKRFHYRVVTVPSKMVHDRPKLSMTVLSNTVQNRRWASKTIVDELGRNSEGNVTKVKESCMHVFRNWRYNSVWTFYYNNFILHLNIFILFTRNKCKKKCQKILQRSYLCCRDTRFATHKLSTCLILVSRMMRFICMQTKYMYKDHSWIISFVKSWIHVQQCTANNFFLI